MKMHRPIFTIFANDEAKRSVGSHSECLDAYLSTERHSMSEDSRRIPTLLQVDVVHRTLISGFIHDVSSNAVQTRYGIGFAYYKAVVNDSHAFAQYLG